MRLLLVEDDLEVGELVQEALSGEGYAVDWVKDGQEALGLCQAFPYDLVVLDVRLPRLDGFGVLNALRQRGNQVPVLMLTARDALEDRVTGLEGGADDYLVKPFHLRELRARVRVLLRRGGGQASNQLEVGRLRLDLGAKRVWSGEAPVDPRILDPYISRLRSKLAQGAIETRRGLGYRFLG